MATEARVLANRYELGAEVGRGGMARVYVAFDRLLERTVAVKVLSALDAHDATSVERFRREAQAAARLSHPNIVGVYDWGEDDDTAFIVMEYVDGSTLREVLYARDRLMPVEAARVAAQIAAALSFAHHNGVVHRDVKPGNVLITPDGEVKVTDFGIARADSTDALTKTGSVMGTATYFSPEQAQGLHLDGRSDVYSLGVVLYEMVTGEAPFTADSPVSVAYKHVREEPVPPSALDPDIPGAMDRIVLTAMAKDVDARYQSAEELRADLMRFERGRPILGGPIPAERAGGDETLATVPVIGGTGAAAAADGAGRRDRTASTVPPRRRSRWGAIVAIVVALGLLVTAIVVLLAGSDLGNDEPEVPTANVDGVVGQPFAEAAATLEAAGFKVAREDVENTAAAELVLAQSPERGRRAEKGSTVTLTVSSANITAPDVVGKPRAEATALLAAKGLTAEVVEVDSEQAPGTVLAMEPAAGGLVPKTAPTVRLQVAREPPIPVPDVAGQGQTAAAGQLTSMGFQPAAASEPSTAVPLGTVIRTDPPAGTPIPRGSTVTLVVSSGPQLIAIPNTVGQMQADAEAALLGAGFNVTVQPQPSPPENKGKVLSQTPAGGEAPRLTNVTIVVGS